MFRIRVLLKNLERPVLKPREGQMIKPHNISNKAAQKLERQHKHRMKKMRGGNLLGGENFGQLGRVGKASPVRTLSGDALEARRAELEGRARSEGQIGPAHLHDVITKRLEREEKRDLGRLRTRVLGPQEWPKRKKQKQKATTRQRAEQLPLRKCEALSEDICRALVCPRHRRRLAYCPWAKNGHIGGDSQ